MSDEYKRAQAALVAEHIKKQDIVITTALIPGRPAPVLVSEDMVKSMKPGSIIVDLAAERGGNCPLTEPGKTVVKHGVTIIGDLNVAAQLSVDASALYSKNLLNFITPLIDKDTKALDINWEDEIITGTALTRDGQVVHPSIPRRSKLMETVIDPIVFRLAIFVLAIFVGYYVVWSVTPALHTPLMSVTNAISSVIIVGALIAVGVDLMVAGDSGWMSKGLGFVAVILASVNIFGGFLVTQRMLAMYKKKER